MDSTRETVRDTVILIGANLLIYGRALSRFFVSDDFELIEAATRGSVADILWRPGLCGFYRPLPLLIYRGLYSTFGLAPIPFNILNLSVHSVNTILVYQIARGLTGSSTAGIWSGAIFAVHFIHVAPVTWVSTLNTLIATCAALIVIRVLQRTESSLAPLALLLSAGAFLVGLSSKETAVVIPLVAALYLAVFPSRTLRARLFSFAPLVLMLGGYLLLRLGPLGALGDDGIHLYRLGMNIPKNLAFMFVSVVAPLDFRLLLGLWNASPHDPISIVWALLRYPLAFAIICTSAVFYLTTFLRGDKTIRFGILWIAVAALTVLPLKGSGERFVYLPSVGFALFAGALVGRLRQPTIAATERIGYCLRRRVPISSVAGLFLCIYLAAFAHRSTGRWITASHMAERVIRDTIPFLEDAKPHERFYLLHHPENYQGAWVLRSGLGAGVRLISGRSGLRAVPARELSDVPAGPGIRLLRYVEGRVVDLGAVAP